MAFTYTTADGLSVAQLPTLISELCKAINEREEIFGRGTVDSSSVWYGSSASGSDLTEFTIGDGTTKSYPDPADFDGLPLHREASYSIYTVMSEINNGIGGLLALTSTTTPSGGGFKIRDATWPIHFRAYFCDPTAWNSSGGPNSSNPVYTYTSLAATMSGDNDRSRWQVADTWQFYIDMLRAMKYVQWRFRTGSVGSAAASETRYSRVNNGFVGKNLETQWDDAVAATPSSVGGAYLGVYWDGQGSAPFDYFNLTIYSALNAIEDFECTEFFVGTLTDSGMAFEVLRNWDVNYDDSMNFSTDAGDIGDTFFPYGAVSPPNPIRTWKEPTGSWPNIGSATTNNGIAWDPLPSDVPYTPTLSGTSDFYYTIKQLHEISGHYSHVAFTDISSLLTYV